MTLPAPDAPSRPPARRIRLRDALRADPEDEAQRLVMVDLLRAVQPTSLLASVAFLSLGIARLWTRSGALRTFDLLLLAACLLNAGWWLFQATRSRRALRKLESAHVGPAPESDSSR